jgi:hypothetical protein
MSGGTVKPFLPCFCAFFCSTAPQAFFRPDRRFRTPARASKLVCANRQDNFVIALWGGVDVTRRIQVLARR